MNVRQMWKAKLEGRLVQPKLSPLSQKNANPVLSSAFVGQVFGMLQTNVFLLL